MNFRISVIFAIVGAFLISISLILQLVISQFLEYYYYSNRFYYSLFDIYFYLPLLKSIAGVLFAVFFFSIYRIFSSGETISLQQIGIALERNKSLSVRQGVMVILLKSLGWITILSAFIVGISSGSAVDELSKAIYGSRYEQSFRWDVAIVWWVSGAISSIFFFALSLILESIESLREEIRNRAT